MKRVRRMSFLKRLKPRMSRPVVGRLGEWIATGYVLFSGYRILARNFRARCGELDLIVSRFGHIRIIEVRTVVWRSGCDPIHSVGLRKQRQLLRVARHAIAHLSLQDSVISFDVIGIRLRRWGWPEVVWIQDCVDEESDI